jgi:uncharacterized membrane protein
MRLPLLLALTFSSSAASAQTPVKADFLKNVKPILEAACLHCHNSENTKGDFNMETKELLVKGGEDGPGLVPGDASKSPIYTLSALPEDDDDVMPPAKEGLLEPEQLEIIKSWINDE